MKFEGARAKEMGSKGGRAQLSDLSRRKYCGSRQTTSSRPCRALAGWGTDHLHSGQCRDHDDTALESLKALKKRVLELLDEGVYSIKQIGQKIGKSAVTIWRWRRDDPEFDREIRPRLDSADLVRIQIVEDSLYERLVKGHSYSGRDDLFLV